MRYNMHYRCVFRIMRSPLPEGAINPGKDVVKNYSRCISVFIFTLRAAGEEYCSISYS